MGIFTADGDLSVQWDREIPLYWPGERVHGTATFTPKHDMYVTSITMGIVGMEHCHYSSDNQSQTNIHAILRQEQTASLINHQMQMGNGFHFPFDFTLPPNLPWSQRYNDHILPKNGRSIVTAATSNGVMYCLVMNVESRQGKYEKLGAPFYVTPPPGGRYTPLPMDPARPGHPLPMSAHVESTPCCSKRGLVNLTGSVPCLVTSPSRGTQVSLHIENVGEKPVTLVKWELRYHILRRFQSTYSATHQCSGGIHGIKGVCVLKEPIQGMGGETKTPLLIDIRPDSPEHRDPDNSTIKGYDQLGEYAWEKEFLTLPAQDYRKIDTTSQGEITQIYMRNTYVRISTDVQGCGSAKLDLPLHFVTNAALDAAPVPCAPMADIDTHIGTYSSATTSTHTASTEVCCGNGPTTSSTSTYNVASTASTDGVPTMSYQYSATTSNPSAADQAFTYQYNTTPQDTGAEDGGPPPLNYMYGQ
ncbi:hypothetical protein KIPB_003346 [Kipferlia bialata]|uniref:Arrestin-like N-terminal domain-containing protein n=1 Tax=Kipferlia bialata TaxID=797122 RepID=A0A9K3GH51_9EUKA|nr:hypothetical protein KIPB_003346 [Kipferlia bialata]|eukprot:g3346.t1